MPILGEFFRSIKKIGQDKFLYFLLFFQLLIFVARIRQIGTDSFLIFNLFLLVIILLFQRRRLFDSFFFKLTVFYILICILPITFFGFNANLYTGFYIRMVIGLLIAKIFQERLLEMFENIVFVLAVISIPLFIVQVINVNFFNIFGPITKAVLQKELLADPSPVGYKYLIIFLVNPGGLLRNSGFCNEPAVFGAVLTWALLFNFMISKFEMNQRASLFIVTAFTTFSVGTFSYLLVAFLLYFYQQKKTKGLIVLIILGVSALGALQLPIVQQQLTMMQDKVNEEPARIDSVFDGRIRVTEVSRVAGFYINMKYFFKWPLGYGFAKNKGELRYLAASPNGLMHIVVRWGIGGILLFTYCVYRLILLLKSRYYYRLKLPSIWLGMLLFILPFTGNPFYHKPLLFAFLFLSFTLSFRKENFYAKIN